jgi:hypothetical protein
MKTDNQDLKTKLQDQTWKVKDAEEKQRKAEASVKDKEEARAAAQTELDDLFVVLGDLEEKRTRDKVGTHTPLLDVNTLTCCRNVSRSLERKYPMQRTKTKTRMEMKMKMKMKKRTRRSRLDTHHLGYIMHCALQAPFSAPRIVLIIVVTPVCM